MDFPLDIDFINSCLPHGPEMVLLDQVTRWQADEIDCLSWAHENPNHPLRRDGLLPAISIVEIAAQAMAVHSAISAGEEKLQRKGVLAGVRKLNLHRARLDDIIGPIAIKAKLVMGEDRSGIYDFEAKNGDQLIGSGRLTVVIPK